MAAMSSRTVDFVANSPDSVASPASAAPQPLSLDQRAESLFNLLDTSGCGYLTEQDLLRCCCCGDGGNNEQPIGGIDADDVSAVFARLDTDGDGRIDANDFKAAIGLLLTAAPKAPLESSLCAKAYSQENGLDGIDCGGRSGGFSCDHRLPEEIVGQLTCRDQVSELHKQLSRHCPHLLDSFEVVMANVARDVGAQKQERQRLEETFQRARLANERHVRQLEEEAETQLARMEQQARERERRRLEDEYQELLRTKEREVGQLRHMIEHMQTAAAAAAVATAQPAAAEQRRQQQLQQQRRHKQILRRQRARRKADTVDSAIGGGGGGVLNGDSGSDGESEDDEIGGGGSDLEGARQERLLADMRRLETALALSSSEVARLRQDRDDGERELQMQRHRLREHQQKQERLTRQLQDLHSANRSLNDTNDSLRAALERQRSLATSSVITASPALSVHDLNPTHEAVLPAYDTCEEDDDPSDYPNLVATAPASGEVDPDSGMSTFRDLPDDTVSGHHQNFARRPNSLALNLHFHGSSPRRFSDDDEEVHDGDVDDSASATSSSSGRMSPEAEEAEVAEVESPTVAAPERLFRIVMAGDAAVGKSCFVTRFCESRFDSSSVSTLGVDFKTRTVVVDGRMVAIQLWDTAGQERFRSIAKSYFRRADGVILLYDCTCDRSFISVRDWIESIRESCCVDPPVPIMIVANKTDLRHIARNSGRRVVEQAEGQRLADMFQAAMFVEASARRGENVRRSVVQLCRLLQLREDQAISGAAAAMQLREEEGAGSGKKLPSCCP